MDFPQKQELLVSTEEIVRTKTEILRTLDEICEKYGLCYFAFGRLLVECVHYGDVLQESEDKPWDIGMMRSDYNRLVEILRVSGKEWGLFLKQYRRGSKNPDELFRLGKVCSVQVGDLTVNRPCWVFLSPFDTVPDDFDYFCGYVREMRRVNKYYRKICNSYEVKHGIIGRALRRIRYLNDTPRKAFQRRDRIAAQFNNTNNQSVCRAVVRKSKVLKKDQLFPIQRLPFRGGNLPCPQDYSVWTAPMTPELVKQTKEIQKVDLFLLKEFDRVCRKLGIGYFVCGGTMLGCMRHGGFIPWDDDVDVGMIREDYDRFLREAGQYLDSRCFLQTRESDPKIPYLFSKIRVNNTEYITEYNEHRDFHKGICLDIFPFDVLPQDENEKEKFLKRTVRLVSIHNRFSNKALPEPQYRAPEVTLKEKWFHFVGRLQRIIYRSMPLAVTQKWYIRHVTKYNHLLDRNGNCEVASFVPSYTHIKTEDLLPYKDAQFENLTVMVPNKPEIFLTMQYGDFMCVPPIHQQNGHTLVRYNAKFEE